MDLLFDKAGQIKKEYCFHNHPMLEYDSVRNWFAEVRPSHSYKRHGLAYLREFCEFLNKDPDALVRERKVRLKKDPSTRMEEHLLGRWHQELLQCHMPSTAQGKFSKIVSFFNFNYAKLNIPRFPSVSLDEYHGSKRLQKKEIQIMMGFADTYRDKILLLVGSESGLRVRALEVLELGHLVRFENGTQEGVVCESIQDLSKALVPVRIQLPKRFYFGNKKEGITFLCHDAVELILEDLNHRESRGEPIGPKTPLMPTYPVTVRTRDNNAIAASHLSEFHPIGSELAVTVPRPLGAGGRPTIVEATVESIRPEPTRFSTLEMAMRRLRLKAHITHREGVERPATVHSMRKYLHSTLDACGVNAVLVNVILGHSSRISDHYSGKHNLGIEEIRSQYHASMYRIAITGETDAPRVVKLEEQVKVLEEEQRKFMEELVSLRASFISLDKTKRPSELIVEPVPRTEGLRPLTETKDTSKNASPALLEA